MPRFSNVRVPGYVYNGLYYNTYLSCDFGWKAWEKMATIPMDKLSYKLTHKSVQNGYRYHVCSDSDSDSNSDED